MPGPTGLGDREVLTDGCCSWCRPDPESDPPELGSRAGDGLSHIKGGASYKTNTGIVPHPAAPNHTPGKRMGH